MNNVTIEDRWAKLKVYLEAERSRWPKKHRRDLRQRILNFLNEWPESIIWVTIQETPKPAPYLLRVVAEKASSPASSSRSTGNIQ